MADFFTPENAVALFLTLIIVILLLKIWLEKKEYFKKNPGNVMPIVILALFFLLLFPKILKIGSYALPLIALVGVAIMFLMFFCMTPTGMETSSILKMLQHPSIIFVLKIALVVFLMIGASNVFGKELLEEKSVSLTEGILPQEKTTPEADVSAFFTPQALGIILVLATIGLAFFFINR
jgi:hypothetical protein